MKFASEEQSVKKYQKDKSKALFSSRGVKFWGVTWDVSWNVGRGVRILIKKLITELVCKL
jgi:hypothetical protein